MFFPSIAQIEKSEKTQQSSAQKNTQPINNNIMEEQGGQQQTMSVSEYVEKKSQKKVKQ